MCEGMGEKEEERVRECMGGNRRRKNGDNWNDEATGGNMLVYKKRH